MRTRAAGGRPPTPTQSTAEGGGGQRAAVPGEAGLLRPTKRAWGSVLIGSREPSGERSVPCHCALNCGGLGLVGPLGGRLADPDARRRRARRCTSSPAAYARSERSMPSSGEGMRSSSRPAATSVSWRISSTPPPTGQRTVQQRLGQVAGRPLEAGVPVEREAREEVAGAMDRAVLLQQPGADDAGEAAVGLGAGLQLRQPRAERELDVGIDERGVGSRTSSASGEDAVGGLDARDVAGALDGGAELGSRATSSLLERAGGRSRRT